jgi:ribosomal protein L37AE/L43A
LDDILLHPGSVEFGLSVLRWQRRLRGMAKVDPASKRSPIRCPRCRERQVSRREDGYFECGCGRLLTQAEHDREYARQADEHDHERQEVATS